MKNAKSIRFVGAAILLCYLLGFSSPSWALDPERKLSQYVRKTWEVGGTFPNVSISSIAQGSNGYLWIGTDKGLIRFDGLEFQTVSETGLRGSTPGAIKQLLIDGDSNLWALLTDTSVLSIRNGGIERIRDRAEQGVTSLGYTSNEGALFSSLTFGPLKFESGHFRTLFPFVTEDASVSPLTLDDLSSRTSWTSSVASHRLAEPGVPVSAITQLKDGSLWLGTSDQGLFRFANGKVSRVWKSEITPHITSLLPSPDGKLWIGTDDGLYVWNGKTVSQAALHSDLLHVHVHAMVADRDLNLWIGTDRGIIRVTHAGSVVEHDVAAHQRLITALFVDRAGELWSGGPDGLEMLRDSIFVSFPAVPPAITDVGSLYAGDSGRVWFASLDRGLYSMTPRDDRATSLRSLQNISVYSLAGRGNEIWAGTRENGLIQIRGGAQPIVERRYSSRDGLPENNIYALHVCSDRSVWLATLSSGVSHMVRGHFINYPSGGSSNLDHVNAIEETSDKAVWFATRTGLSRFKEGNWKTYTTQDNLPSNNVTSLFFDGKNTLWIGTIAGVAYFRDGKLQIPTSTSTIFREAVFGITTDHSGKVWMTTSNHIASFAFKDQATSAIHVDEIREYGTRDGLPSTLGVSRSRTIDTDPSGHVWVTTARGLAVANTEHPGSVGVVAAATIETVDIDNSPVDLESNWSVSPGRHRLSFNYSSVNLANPTSTRFRYKLTGYDSNWSAPVTATTAVYTNLSAGTYDFHVVSGTEDGNWNSGGTSITFKVGQVWYKTLPFETSCVVLALFLIWSIHRQRVTRISQTINARFEERLAERTRIARELNDTLFQTLQGSKFVAEDALDSNPDPRKLREVIGQLSDWLQRASEESQATEKSLRSTATLNDDLEPAFRRALALNPFTPGQTFALEVVGDAMEIRPAARDELCLIGVEVIRSTQRHAQGSHLDVKLQYKRNLILRVEDDGAGINSDPLPTTKLYQFELKTMQERAERIGGSLTFHVGPTRGSTVVLSVPGNVIYEGRDRGLIARLISVGLALRKSS
jgi:ligand-binding sensor domain-containing protein/signal transduction histidine kinase